jgi:hypothetical protein
MTQLTKLQIRTIQSQKQYKVSTSNDATKTQTYTDLYILGKSMFYLAQTNDKTDPITEDVRQGKDILITFKDENGTFTTVCKAEIIDKENEEFEDASEFFSQESSKIDHILELTIKEVQ